MYVPCGLLIIRMCIYLVDNVRTHVHLPGLLMYVAGSVYTYVSTCTSMIITVPRDMLMTRRLRSTYHSLLTTYYLRDILW